MKIAIDTRETNTPKSGKAEYAFRMVQAILNQDTKHEYLLYTQKENPEFKPFKQVTQKVFPQHGWRWHWAVLRDLKEERPDRFWAPTSYIIPALAPKWLKVVLTVHDLVAFVFPMGHARKALWLERLTLKRAIQNAYKIAVVSKSTANDLKKRFKIPKGKFIHTPCAAAPIFSESMSLQKIKAVKKIHALPKRFLLSVGTLSPRKNIHRLIQAYQALDPEDELVIVGKKGWHVKEIFKAASGDRRIHFVEDCERDELAAMYRLASGFIFPSLYEGFGIPPLEAMASGCPTLVSNVSSLPEVVGKAAIFVNPHSVESIQKGLDQLIHDKALRKDLIEKGKLQVKNFSWKQSAQNWLNEVQ